MALSFLCDGHPRDMRIIASDSHTPFLDLLVDTAGLTLGKPLA